METNIVYSSKDNLDGEDEWYQLAPQDKNFVAFYMVQAYVYDYVIAKERLKIALEALLDRYPFLAGRLGCDPSHGRLCIHCGNYGVPLTFNNSLLCRDDILPLVASLKLQAPESSLDYATLPPPFESMQVSEVEAGRAPLVQLRVTALADGGSVLAVSMSHAVADGRGLFALLCDLATLCRGEEPPPRFVDRSVLCLKSVFAALPADDASKLSARMDIFQQAKAAAQQVGTSSISPLPTNDDDVAAPQSLMTTVQTMVLHIPQADITAMKKLTTDGGIDTHVSTTNVVTALLWALLLDAKSNNMLPLDGHSVLTFSSSMVGKSLSRLGLLPSNYIGNALSLGCPQAMNHDISGMFAANHHDETANNVRPTVDGITTSFIALVRAVIEEVRRLKQDDMYDIHFLLKEAMAAEDMRVYTQVRPVVAPDAAKHSANACGHVTASGSGFAPSDGDFGQGVATTVIGSVLPISSPFRPLCCIGPGLGLGGVLVCIYVLEEQVPQLTSSQVLRAIAPRAKFIK